MIWLLVLFVLLSLSKSFHRALSAIYDWLGIGLNLFPAFFWLFSLRFNLSLRLRILLFFFRVPIKKRKEVLKFLKIYDFGGGINATLIYCQDLLLIIFKLLEMMKKSVRYIVRAIFVSSLMFTGHLVAQPNNYDAQVEAGVEYFRQQANEQLPLVKDLLSAPKSGDIEKAQSAYVKSRPPYEVKYSRSHPSLSSSADLSADSERRSFLQED